MSLAWWGRARNRWIIIGIALGTLPIIVAFVMMRRHWTSVPFYDEWYTPGTQIVSFFQGALSISDLWGQHDEGRKLFPRLYYLTLTWLSGRWDVKDEMLSMFALACAGYIGWSIGLLSHGSHTIKITTDSTNQVSESNESDNTYSKTIFVN